LAKFINKHGRFVAARQTFRVRNPGYTKEAVYGRPVAGAPGPTCHPGSAQRHSILTPPQQPSGGSRLLSTATAGMTVERR